VAVLQIAIAPGITDLEVAVVTEQFVTARNINIIAIEANASQAAVCATAFEIDATGIPVDMLFTVLILEINRKNAAVALALLAAAHNGGRDEFG